jgi:hypothetical protein
MSLSCKKGATEGESRAGKTWGYFEEFREYGRAEWDQETESDATQSAQREQKGNEDEERASSRRATN